jgi:hypothetical protein
MFLKKEEKAIKKEHQATNQGVVNPIAGGKGACITLQGWSPSLCLCNAVLSRLNPKFDSLEWPRLDIRMDERSSDLSGRARYALRLFIQV